MLEKYEHLVALVSKHIKVMDENIPPEKLNRFLVQEWLRAKGGVFRGQLQGKAPDKEDYRLLSELGFIDTLPIPEELELYDGIVVFGATMPTFAFRLNFLIESFLKRDMNCSSLPKFWLLASQRPLIEKIESRECLPNVNQKCLLDSACQLAEWPLSEDQVLKFVWTFSGLNSLVSEMELVSSASLFDDEAKMIRYANTEDTVIDWLELVSDGKYLLVSNQPYCQNQLAIARKVVAKKGRNVEFSVCGEYDKIPLDRILDTVAKQLNEEMLALQG